MINFTHLRFDIFPVLGFVVFALNAAPVFHPEPRFPVNVRMDVIFVVGQFNLVPFGIIKGHLLLRHDE